MEIWKNVVGWEEFYEISNLGNIESKVRKGKTSFGERTYAGKQVNAFVHSNGYLTVNLTTNKQRKQVSVHRLVAQAFLGNCPDGMECCHNNGIKNDCRLENLRWDTRKNNHADKKIHGTQQHNIKKLTPELAKEIKEIKEKAELIAKKYNISVTQIWRIKTGRSWNVSQQKTA